MRDTGSDVTGARPPADSPPPPGDWLAALRDRYTRRIAGRLALPHLLLVAVVAVVATYAAVSSLVDALEQKFRDDLAASGLSANKAMVRIEANHLAVLRQMTFTEGVDGALAERDAAALERLLAPIAANARTPYVDVFAANGTELLALRSPDLGPNAPRLFDPNARAWDPVAAVLRGDSDSEGDKYAGIVDAPWGVLLVSATPVRRDGQMVGALAVGLPIQEVAARLSEESASVGVTLYRRDGAPLTSTIRAAPTTLEQALQVPREQANLVLTRDEVVVRRTTIDEAVYVEAVGALAVRRQLALLIGVSSPGEIIDLRSADARNWMIAIFIVAILATVAIAFWLAQRLPHLLRALRETTNGPVLAVPPDGA